MLTTATRWTSCLLALAFTAIAHGYSPDLRQLDSLPLHIAPLTVVEKQIAAARAVKGSGPALFAATVALPIDLTGGVWDAVDAETWRWRSRVYSAGALSLLMSFEQFDLPQGAALWIYDVEGHTVQGPYTRADRSPEGGLWTPIVPGDTAVIEVRVPRELRAQVHLKLARLGHGYKNARDLGESGACNVDVACALGDGWRNEIRSVVKLQVPAGAFVGLCTGTLVNNLRQDDTPYVLTADHCGIGDIGSAASGVVSYWNFQNTACGGVDNARDRDTQTGATLIADDRDTDMTLIRLNATPNAAFNVYYAGFDASGAGGSSGVGIHHPGGDAKKISSYSSALTPSTVRIETGGPDIPAWRVLQWDLGTTEPGSSGSGLWNQNKRVVGTLSGGGASCVGNVDNNASDYYARLDTQWTAKTAAASQLKAWLDPDNSGARSVAGKNPGTQGPLTLQADSLTLSEDSAAVDIDVLANDPSNLTLVSVTAPNLGGSASIVANKVRYQPAANANGTETFQYTARDAANRSATATVTVTLTAVNDPPTAVNDQFSAAAGVSSDLPVLSNDSSAPDSGETLTLISVSDFSQGGSATIAGNMVRYTPATGFGGIETFRYSVRDSGGLSSSATVTVTVSGTAGGGNGSSSGGGSLGAGALLLLVVGSQLRRRQRRH